MCHTAVSATQASSVTLQIWQHGAKENYCNFASFNTVVDTKTSIIQMGLNTLNLFKKMNLNDGKFLISQNTLAVLKGPNGKYNLHYVDVRGDFLGPPQGITPAAVIANQYEQRTYS